MVKQHGNGTLMQSKQEYKPEDVSMNRVVEKEEYKVWLDTRCSPGKPRREIVREIVWAAEEITARLRDWVLLSHMEAVASCWPLPGRAYDGMALHVLEVGKAIES